MTDKLTPSEYAHRTKESQNGNYYINGKSIAAVSSAGREIADNTTSIFSLITSPWILVAFLIAGFGGFIVYDRMKKGREAGV